MNYVQLGNTNLRVSKLAFGTLTMGPLQANLSVDQGALLLERAWELGVNFLDTADLYDNYPQIREGLRRTRGDWIIASKSYDYTREGMKASLEKARKGLNRDVVDLWMLHETESMHTIKGHWEAVEYLLEAKEQGRIRHIGASTHHVAGVSGVLEFDALEVVHPIYNKRGLGILDGTVTDMEEVLRKASEAGKGIFVMKPLGGGHLIGERKKAMDFLRNKDWIHSIAMGMQTLEEVEYNVALVNGTPISDVLEEQTLKRSRSLHIDDWCDGCGCCVAVCPQGALTLKEEKSTVNRDLCILCGYCAPRCPQFCIKVV